MTYEDLRNELRDYYGAATGFFPEAWGNVIAVDCADNEELLHMAEEAEIDTSGLEEES